MKTTKHEKLKALFAGLFVLKFPITDQSGEKTADARKMM